MKHTKAMRFEFDANYGRDGVIEVVLGRCDVCRVDDVPVLLVEDSLASSAESEYGGGAICRICIERAFDGAAQDSKQHPLRRWLREKQG